MNPVFVDFGFIAIRWYGVMMAMGFIAALVNWTLLGKKEGKDVTFCSDLLFWIMIAGILGARVAYVCANTAIFIDNPLSVVRLDQGGLIFYGGLIAAIFVVIPFARIRKVEIPALYDFAATSVPLSHALGRVGCYLNGCCYGKASPNWAGGAFPVQLLEALFNIALYLLLLLVYRRKKRSSMVAAVYLIAYPLGRFLTELMRGDPRMRLSALSIAQIISLILLTAGIALFTLLKCRPISDNQK